MRACARSLCFTVSPVTTAAQKLPFSPFVCGCVWGGFFVVLFTWEFLWLLRNSHMHYSLNSNRVYATDNASS